ncbi:Pkinase domain-containing protein [Ceratobasidium theobromae]|uniref:Pkinase domain-containing protein n=1 Tax=Ceratobasidium theobromae TaxID=1582974 RepID=A0A5N5QEZ2_9AGAM|nr:Pkinase domain-containing protein [Ceratobasidium theobromae]
MQWAELGSLDDLILQRLGVKSSDQGSEEPPSGEYQTREDRIRAFRARAGRGDTAHASGEIRRREARRRAREMKAVHLLSAEEIRSLFGDVVAGLAFLHESSFLHLDLKPGNVLLTLDEGQLMLSDFGTAQDALQSSRERTGNTGTLEYCAPESLRHDQDGTLRQVTSKSDMWSLGMVLHKLVYFRLPWKNDENLTELENEIIGFQGYKANTENTQAFAKRRLPVALCQLLSKLLDIDPFERPGSDQVLKVVRSRQLDPSLDPGDELHHEGVGPLVRRPTPPSRGNENTAVNYDTDSHNSAILVQEPSTDMPSMDIRNSRAASGTQMRRRSDPVGEIGNITPRLLVLDGPTSAGERVAGLVSTINISRLLSRGFKCALLISKTILLINLCVPTPPKIAALSFVIGLGLLDMWTRRLRWSFALVVLHLAFIWTASRERMALVNDEMDIDMEDEGQTPAESSALVGVNNFMFIPPPKDTKYGEPHLDRLPPIILERILSHLGTRAIAALRRTCKALNNAISDTPEIWAGLVRRFRRATSNVLLMGSHPVLMPRVDHANGYQEDLLRCAYILRRKWSSPVFQARQLAGTNIIRHGAFGFIDQADSMGRYFLTVSRSSVVLWTLEPNSVPRRCREVFPGEENAPLPERDMIVRTMVTRPGTSLVAYLAVQISQQRSYRLRTEIFQIHLSRPGLSSDSKLGLCAIYETEGALVGFTDYLLAYALGDDAQTILLCCWVTKRATKLVTRRVGAIPYEHMTCRALAFGSDIIVVVRDSFAEIYPREEFTVLDPDLYPSDESDEIIQGDFEMLPTTYATDIATFHVSFITSPQIFIHSPRSASYPNGNNSRASLAIRVISLIGVARSPILPTDPSIPYSVTTARVCQTPKNPESTQPTSPPPSAPPSPPAPTNGTAAQPSPGAHTNAPVNLHTTPYLNLPHPERYRFVFHIHALQPQHPHLAYGPIINGPNGRAVMLATHVGPSEGPGQARQFVLKFRHPSSEELFNFVKSKVPRPPPRQPSNGALQQPVAHITHPSHPIPHVPAPQGPDTHPNTQLPTPPPNAFFNPTGPRPDPLAPLLELTRPIPILDVSRGMSHLWQTFEMVFLEILAWDEGSGTLLIANRRGRIVVLECARPALQPRGLSS